MNELGCLLDRFWVTRSENKDLYFSIKRAIPQFRKFINEQLGWNLIVNESVVKLEKVPPKAMSWMGISSFQDSLDYCLLCALLLYLSDLDDGEQFLLSSLTEGVERFLEEYRTIDWTRFLHRKSLVRVLRYAQEIGLLVVYDGSSDHFGSDQNQEVLYENTGLSRDFTVHYGRDILHCQSIADFEAFSWEGEEAEYGRQRIHRVYQQLTLAPAFYWSEDQRGDYEYIKNQRAWISKYMGEALNGTLEVYQNGAFFVLDETQRFGMVHPRDLALCDAALLLCAQLRTCVQQGTFLREPDDTVLLTRREFQHQVYQCRRQYGNGLSRSLRALSDEALCQELQSYLQDWMLLGEQGDVLCLYPAAARWTGAYPVDYNGETGEEQADGPMEDAQTGIS